MLQIILCNVDLNKYIRQLCSRAAFNLHGPALPSVLRAAPVTAGGRVNSHTHLARRLAAAFFTAIRTVRIILDQRRVMFGAGIMRITASLDTRVLSLHRAPTSRWLQRRHALSSFAPYKSDSKALKHANTCICPCIS